MSDISSGEGFDFADNPDFQRTTDENFGGVPTPESTPAPEPTQVEMPEPPAVQSPADMRYEFEKQAFIRGYGSKELPEGVTDTAHLFDIYKGKAEANAAEPVIEPTGDVEVPSTEDVADDAKLEIDTPEEVEAQEVTDFVQARQEAWQGWTDELASSGELSDDSRNAAAEMMGVDREVVDIYVEGYKAKNRAQYSTAANVVGGQDSLNTILKWSATNLSEAERINVNNQLLGPNSEMVLLGLKAKYDAANPATPSKQARSAEPKNVKQAATGAVKAGPEVFPSRLHMNAAMNDPRYSRDPGYRAQVEARMQATWTANGGRYPS